MAQDRSDIEEIKSRLDIVQLVRHYVDLKPVGDRWTGACPFHQETKPSFSVNPELGLFYCFGCQASGDVLDFYCRINGLDFAEGLRELAEETGVQLRQARASGKEEQSSLRRRCLAMHELAQSFFRQCLAGQPGEPARSYLARRGIAQASSDAFGLGYSPDSWNGLKNALQEQGYTAEQGASAGLLSQNRQGRIYDRFRGRIMFPIYDLGGRVVAFGGRIIGEGEPKYLNSSDTPIFKKGDLLYGLYQARQSITQSKEALLTEGYSDVLTLAQSGFSNACGVLGTALTSAQVKRLSGLCRSVTLIFDGDRAGEQASLRSAAMVLQAGLAAKVVSLPQGEDVDSFLRQEGAEALQALLQEAREGLAFCLSMISVYYAPREMLRWAVDFLQGLPETAWQAYYLPRIAKGLQLSEAELRQALSEPRVQRERKEMARALQSSSPGARDRELLRFALCYPQYIPRLRDYGLEDALRTERGRAFWSKLVRHGHSEDILQLLDEGEKRFYVQSKFNPAYNVDPEQVWADLQAFLSHVRKEREQKSLQQSLSMAQQRGDTQEVFRLLEQFSRFSKGEE